MGYLNNVTGYREDLLANRAIVKHGNFALLTPDGLVKNIIPGFENCDATILGSDSNLLIVFYVQIMPDDLVMQLHRF